RRGGAARTLPPGSARRAAAPRAVADHRSLSAAADRSGDPQEAAAPAAAPVRVPDRPDAAEAARRGAGCRDPRAAGGARGAGVARAVPRGFPARRARATRPRRARTRARGGSRGRDAAAPGRRTLPARPGARGVQSRRCARLAGLSRHEPRDAPPDGGGGGGPNAAPPAPHPRRLPQWARRGVAAFRTPAPARHIGGVWRKTTPRRAAIDALCELIAQHAP